MFCISFSIQNSKESLVMIDSSSQNIIEFSKFFPTLEFIIFIILYLSLIIKGQYRILQDNEYLRWPFTGYHPYKTRFQINFLLFDSLQTANI